MRHLIDIIEAEAKDGREIVFQRVEDSEGDDNRGFQVDRIVASIDGEEVGYLKLMYIPKERFGRYYGSIFNYLTQIGGKACLPYDNPTVDYRKLDEKQLRRLIMYSTRGGIFREREVESKSREELLMLAKDLEKQLMTGSDGKEFRHFKKRLVNSPYVDFIRVDDGMQRLGIGTALYLEGAKWMAEKGMRFRASTIQSKEAQAIWAEMERRGMTDRVGKTLYMKPPQT